MSEISIVLGALAVIIASVTALIFKFVKTTQQARDASRLELEQHAQSFIDLTRHELEAEIETRINEAIKKQEIEDNAKNK